MHAAFPVPADACCQFHFHLATSNKVSGHAAYLSLLAKTGDVMTPIDIMRLHRLTRAAHMVSARPRFFKGLAQRIMTA
jgi:hypothetical protein